MKFFTRLSFALITGLLLVVLASACGGSTGTGSGPSYQSTPAQSTPTTATTPASTGGGVVKTAQAKVDGKEKTILTDAKGMTLYYFTPDKPTATACTGGCASTWPPLLASGSDKPKAEGNLSGELEIYPNANGKQIVYNDHPLYTYVGDSAPGQLNGQGVGGKWFVATSDLTKNK